MGVGVLGLLRYSEYPDIAQRFMEYAESEQGRLLFQQYGFLDQTTLPESGTNNR